MKRIIAASIALLAFAFGVGNATAASSGATIDLLPVSFSLSSTSTNGFSPGCQYMPAGVTITWEGTEKSVTVVRTDQNGVTTVQNSSHAFGQATDQNGRTYAFDYSNEFRVTETSAGSGMFTGTMTDHFSLAGNGLTLVNGFLSGLTTNLADVFIFQPGQSRGDPIDFATGAPHCDPL